MFNLTQQELITLLIEAIVQGVLWGLTFYFIRKGMNKRNFVEDSEKKREAFYWDGIYGGFSAFCLVIAKKLVLKNLSPLMR